VKKYTMIRIGYSFLAGVAFAFYGRLIGVIINSPVPIAVVGFILGLLCGYYTNPEM
jgi:xanthosine utilization system XapX-like protein